MSLLLALENELHKKIRYAIGSSAVILKLAEDVKDSGLVSENVNVIVRFKNSDMVNPNRGANTPAVRSKVISYEVQVIYKNSQRLGHSFALAMLDSISQQINGYVPDLVPSLNTDPHSLPSFQTGFELKSETFQELTEASQYVYTQNYDIQILLPQAELSGYPCPLTYDKTTLKNCLPCKRCLKTVDKTNIGIAEWKNQGTGKIIYIVDNTYCPTRPLDKLEVLLQGNKNEDNLYDVEIIFTPEEAISYDPVKGEIIDESLKITSVFSNYFDTSEGQIPDFCKDFTLIFDVYADDPGDVNREGNYKLSTFSVFYE